MNDRAAIKSMRSKQPGGFLIVVILMLVVLLAYQLWLSYRDQVSAAETNARNLAAIFETRLEATLRRTDADLKALEEAIPMAALSQKAVPAYKSEINANLDSRLFNVDEMAGYRVHDVNGDTLYATESERASPGNVAHQAYFQELRQNPGAALVFSELASERGSSRQVLVIARALHTERGRFAGVVLGMLELDSYRKQFQALDLGSKGMIALLRSDSHAQLVRWPDDFGALNKPLASDHPIARSLASGDRVLSLHYSLPPENVSRIIGVATVPYYPFYFVAGFGLDDVLAGWRTQAIVVGVSMGLLFGLVGFLLYRLGRMRVREAGILTNLAQSRMMFSELAQLVPVGICHFDRRGVCTFFNDRHLALTGRSREQLIGSRWSDFVHPDDLPKILAARGSGQASETSFVCEYRIVRPDGQMTFVIGEVQTEIDASGNVRGHIVAQTDISLLKAIEEKLLLAKHEAEMANRSKTRFLAAASHDLRQPIQAISLFHDALKRTDLSEEQKTISRFLSMSVNSLGELLYSLLDISKLDAGLLQPQMKAVAAEELFATIDAEFSPLARQNGLRFKFFYPGKEMLFFTDGGLLMSVLRNLIDNAFKYTTKGGVLVGVRKRCGYGVIQVWDTGIGIDPQYKELVFEECFQVGNVMRDRTKGLGIGLSIARRMARLLQGDVTFRSRLGCGTVFEIILPLVEERAAPDTPVVLQPLPASETQNYSDLAGQQVVLVEDDPMVAKSIELLLETLAIKVRSFASAELALASPDTFAADFYISDFSLPGMSGLQFLDAVQQRLEKPINAVLLTGETSPARIAQAASSCWRVMFKPAELSKLLAAMKSPEWQSSQQ